MSKVVIQGNNSGTGTFTVTAPNSNNSREITLPDISGTLVSTDSNGNVGIGTSLPDQKLSISEAEAYSYPINLRTTATDGGYSESGLQFIPSGTSIPSYIIFSNQMDCRVFLNGAGRFSFASNGQLSAVVPGGTTLYPSFTARAWVNFNGTGTVAIRASGNVSSITDLGVGYYRVTFATAMPDVNYCFMGTSATIGATAAYSSQTTYGEVYINDLSSTAVDNDNVNVAVFR